MARILVIDDDRKLRDVISRALERAGHNVFEADDGDAGVRLYREHGADVIITDIFMPERDGLETIQQLRREYSGVKIIAISGGDRTQRFDLRQDAEILGASRTLLKPFDQAVLVSMVRELLGEANPGSPKQEP
jgi:CheY-like chemotaxis protein